MLDSLLVDWSEPSRPQPVNETQRGILRLVRRSPGTLISEIAGSLHTKYATIWREAQALERMGMIDHVRSGGRLHLYDPSRHSEKDAVLAHMKGNEVRRKVLESIARIGPSIERISRIAEDAGVSFSLAKRIVLDLEKVGLVRIVRRGHRYEVQALGTLRTQSGG